MLKKIASLSFFLFGAAILAAPLTAWTQGGNYIAFPNPNNILYAENLNIPPPVTTDLGFSFQVADAPLAGRSIETKTDITHPEKNTSSANTEMKDIVIEMEEIGKSVEFVFEDLKSDPNKIKRYLQLFDRLKQITSAPSQM